MSQTAAEHCLLREEVCLGLFPETGFDDAGAAMALSPGVGQGQGTGFTGSVLMHRDHAGHTVAGGVLGAHLLADAVGRHHDHIEISPGFDAPVMDVVAVGEDQHAALGQARLHKVAIYLRLDLVRDEHDHHVGSGHRLRGFRHRETRSDGNGPCSRCNPQADTDRYRRILEVHRLGAPLRAESQHCHATASDQSRIGIHVIKKPHGVRRR